MHFENFSDTPTLATSDYWRNCDESTRIKMVCAALQELRHPTLKSISAVSATADGEVIFRVQVDMSAKDRGEFLLDLEEHLKKTVDCGIHIWLEGKEDKNSLRKLRGVKVG